MIEMINMMSLLIIVIINLLSMRKITCLMFEPCAKSKNDTRKKDCISVAHVKLNYKKLNYKKLKYKN